MDAPANQRWFLRKHEDGAVFGPLPFEQVKRWAASAQIAPHDKLSTDEESWIKAPMVPELEMDWLVEVTNERYYGPTTIDAIREFVRLGEIHAGTFLLNSCDGTRMQVRDLARMAPEAAPESSDEVATSDARGRRGASIDMQDRIRELEESLHEERRALAEAEERCRELQSRYNALVGDRAAIG